MNYIILDLEWNNAYFKKIHGFINEIVEFGAVKLDEKFNVIDRFNMVVRSSLTKRLSGRFKELTGMTNETMLDGVDFETALNAYKDWAGENTVTLSWSDSDLYVLYDNCRYFTDNPDNAMLGFYADLQKIFHSFLASKGTPEKNQMSLSKAAERLEIDFEDQNLHHAVDDCLISAKIFEKCFSSENFSSFTLDTNNPEFYKKLRFKAYYIKDINDKDIDKSKLFINCNLCGKKAKMISDWHYKNRNFCADFYCKRCNNKIVGYISFRKLYDKIEIKKKEISVKEK